MRYEILEIRLDNNYKLGDEVNLYNLKGEVMAKDKNLYHIRINDFGNKERILTKTEKREEVIDLYVDAFKKFPVKKFNELSKERNNYIDQNLDKLLLETKLD